MPMGCAAASSIASFHVRTIDQIVAGDSFIELNDWSIGKRAFAATNADSLGLTDGAKPATGYPRTTALCFYSTDARPGR
jgi:hypothetical protein